MFVSRLIGYVGKKSSKSFFFNHHIKITASLLKQGRKVKVNASINRQLARNKKVSVLKQPPFWSQQKQNRVICRDEEGNKKLLAASHLSAGEEIINLTNRGVIKSSPTKTSIEIDVGIHVENYYGQHMNHSPTPNCHIVASCIVSLKDILPGEELTFDYQKNESCLSVPFFCCHSGEYIAGHQRRELNDDDIKIMRRELISKGSCADFVADISYFTAMDDLQMARFMQLFADFAIKRVKMAWPQDNDYHYLQIAKEYRIKMDFQDHRLDHIEMEDYFKLVGIPTDIPTLTPGG